MRTDTLSHKLQADTIRDRALSDACTQWLLYGELESWSQRTLDDRRWWLKRLRRFLEVRALAFDVAGVRSFFLALGKTDPDAGCKKPLKPASLVHVYVLLKAFGSWLVEEEFIPENPLKRVPRPICREDGHATFEEEEIQRLLAAAKRTRDGKRDEALCMFLLDTGLRASELCSLLICDVDLTQRTAVVRNGKGGKTRTVAFGKHTAMTLFRYVKAREKDGPLFPSERGGHLTPNGLSQLMRRLAKLARVKDAHPHKWRHDSAVRQLKNGLNVFAVSAQLGHSDLSTTRLYCKVADADLRRAFESASPMDRLKGRK